jgi:uncharacterized protein (DUF58 family)
MTDSVVAVSLAELVALRIQASQLPEWRRSARAELSGNSRSPFKGRGMEFDETRPYQPGDDVRSLDWRVTARTGRPHTKVFREERERPVWLWVDYRPGMFFATRGMFKSAFAARAAAILAWGVLAHGDRVGGWVVGRSAQQEVKPQRGQRSVLHLLRALADMGAPDAQPRSLGTAALDKPLDTLAKLRRIVRPGSLVFLLTDGRDLESADGHLSDIARHSDVVLCLINDPLEAQLPPPGQYALCDARGRRLTLHTDDPALVQDYAQRFTARRLHFETLAHRHRMRLISAMTNEDPLEVLRRSLRGQPTLRRTA